MQQQQTIFWFTTSTLLESERSCSRTWSMSNKPWIKWSIAPQGNSIRNNFLVLVELTGICGAGKIGWWKKKSFLLASSLSNQHMKLFSLNLFYCMKIEIFTQNFHTEQRESEREGGSSSAAIKYNGNRWTSPGAVQVSLDSLSCRSFIELARLSFTVIYSLCEKQLNSNSFWMYTCMRLRRFSRIFSIFARAEENKSREKNFEQGKKKKKKVKMERTSFVLSTVVAGLLFDDKNGILSSSWQYKRM